MYHSLWSKRLEMHSRSRRSHQNIVSCKKQIYTDDIAQALGWDESGFRPPLCTYRLNWARRTSWRWWDDWDDTVLQTQDSKFDPWRSEAEHATFWSRRLPTILTFTRGFKLWGRYYHTEKRRSKYETFTQWCFNVGPARKTVDHH